MALLSIPNSVAGVSIPGEVGSALNGPLAALFGGAGVQTMKYPSDLATSATKSHYVQFWVKEIIPSELQSSSDPNNMIPGQTIGAPGVGSIATKLANGNIPFTNTSMASVAGKAAGAVSGFIPTTDFLPLGLPTEVKDGVTQSISNAGSAIAKGLRISPTTTKSKAIISLYMPDTLQATYNANYDELSLTSSSTANKLRMVDQLLGKAGNAITDSSKITADRIASALTSDPSVTYLATEFLAHNGMDTSNLQQLLLKGQGYALNPQVQMIYRGMSLRSFSLSFTFTPKSADETQAINNIIYQFKRNFVPRLQGSLQDSNQSMFLVAPSIFNVTFQFGASENKYLPKYGDCVLVDMDVNYAPNGFAAYSDGSPVQTTLNLSFREIEVLTRDKVDAGQGININTNAQSAANPNITNATLADSAAGTAGYGLSSGSSPALKGLR